MNKTSDIDNGLARLSQLPSGLLACPDCRHSLNAEDKTFVCPECGRRFPPVGGLPTFLPAGFHLTEELLEEDRFYTEEPQRDYGPVHDLAHTRAREPIAEGCRLAGLKADSWILSIGVGGGRELRLLEQYSRHIVAIDISPKAMGDFLNREPYAGCVATAERLPITDSTLDAVAISGVLHHIGGYSDFMPYLRECLRVLKPGGAVIITEPNLLYPIGFAMSIVDIVAQRLKPGWRHHVPHERPLTSRAITRALDGAGFDPATVIGTSFVHNKLPRGLAMWMDQHTTALARRGIFRHFGYWVGCTARKPRH